jgi:(2S)-methylsuccinyl-CoA dehydrogenase
MSAAADPDRGPVLVAVEKELLDLCGDALGAADAHLALVRQECAARIAPDGEVDRTALDANQFVAHGFAWTATYVTALHQLHGWAKRLAGGGRLGLTETLILQAGFGEYLNQLAHGIAMSQDEVFRPIHLGLEAAPIRDDAACRRLMAAGNPVGARMRLAELVAANLDTGEYGDAGLDEINTLVREQFRRFADEKVVPFANTWHMNDVLIPLPVIAEMGELGVFGLTLPEAQGGLGMEKIAMCVVTEELSRGYIGVGSLGTRSEIACELILANGTDEQKLRYLAPIAAGEILPTAVFTEPNVGSDLGAVRTRAVRDGDVYRITGNKTWITHGARSDLMTLMARTGAPEDHYRGLTMFLADKPRGDDANPFPAPGMSGTEIRVLGYRGMKEYEIAFDGFEVPASAVLGGREGDGFRQLMATFETARIQTAARAVGVAQNALDLAARYADERVQFGQKTKSFQRVGGKIGWMAIETMIARQLTHFAARQRDTGRRCDIEAGMAKLLAARVAWSNADNAVQVHGGNGYAIEFPISRVLCDARILNIFEGAAEIQAGIIARGLLSGRN